MRDFVTANRSDDAIISVYQDNERCLITISRLNKAAEILLGYSQREIAFQPIYEIFDERTALLIEEEISYADGEKDLFDVISKAKNCILINKQGNKIHVNITPYRVLSFSKDKINYELLIRDASITHQLSLFREQILGKNSYVMDPILEILNESSCRLELDIVFDFLKINQMDGIGCIIETDKDLIQAVNDILHKNVRATDIIGSLGNNKILLILLKCAKQSAESVINRLYNKLIQSQSEEKRLVLSYINILDCSKSEHVLSGLEGAIEDTKDMHSIRKVVIK